MTTGEIIIEGIVQAGALQSAEVMENGNCIFVWHANAEEQIEAALARLGYQLTPIKP